jgi:hypothetical protein
VTGPGVSGYFVARCRPNLEKFESSNCKQFGYVEPLQVLNLKTTAPRCQKIIHPGSGASFCGIPFHALIGIRDAKRFQASLKNATSRVVHIETSKLQTARKLRMEYEG